MQRQEDEIEVVYCGVPDPDQYFRNNPQVLYRMEFQEGTFGMVDQEEDDQKNQEDFAAFHKQIYEEVYLQQLEEYQIYPQPQEE